MRCLCWFISDLSVDLGNIISMIRWSCATILLFFIIKYDGRRLGLSNAPTNMKYGNNRDHRDIASHSSKHTTYSHTFSISSALGLTLSRSHSIKACVVPVVTSTPSLSTGWCVWSCGYSGFAISKLPLASTCGGRGTCIRKIQGLLLLWWCCVVVWYDRRRSGLPSAPLDMEYDNNSIEL